eukprot:g9017.t1
MVFPGRKLIVVLLCQMGYGADAGIPGFHKWFSGAFPTAVSDAPHGRQQEGFDHVCIDMNQILHVALRRAVDEDHAIRRIYKDVNRVLKRLPPRRSVVFAFDGSAPLAKLLVQRQRRENSNRNSKYRMSALHLSPGTKFMEAVASAMEYYAFQECTRPCFERVKFYISGANVPGEGELKCIDWLKRMSKGGSENAVIVGGDADLILQGLALTELQNTFICAQTEARSFRLSSLREVVRSLEELFPGQSEFVRNDMAVLIMFHGNDYLPKVRGVSFERCFRSYTSLKKGKHRDNFLIDGEARSICWEFLADLMADMLPSHAQAAKGYPVMSLEQIDLNSRYPPAGAWFNTVVQKGKLGDGVEIEVHEFSDSDPEGASVASDDRKWRSSTWVRGKEYSWIHTAKKKAAVHEAAAKLLEELVPDIFEKFLEQEEARLLEQAQLDEEKEAMASEDGGDRSSRWTDKKSLFDVEEYLTGVLWNLQMYVDGFVPNHYWHYSRRYSPSIADILGWIQDSNPESLAKVSPPVNRAPPLPAAIAGLCMIPMTDSGRACLPERLQPLVRPGSPLLGSLELQGIRSLNIPRILQIVQEEAPHELRDFHDGSRSSYVWKVVYLDLSARQGWPFPPPPPSRKFLPLEDPRRGARDRFKQIQARSVSGTSAPRNLPWRYPGDSGQPTSDVLDQPYKKAFVGRRDEGGGGRGKGRGARRGGRRASSNEPLSAATRHMAYPGNLHALVARDQHLTSRA